MTLNAKKGRGGLEGINQVNASLAVEAIHFNLSIPENPPKSQFVECF